MSFGNFLPKLPSPGNGEERLPSLVPKVAGDIIHSASDIIHSAKGAISPGNSDPEDPKKNERPDAPTRKSYTSFIPKLPSSSSNGEERQPLSVPQVASDIIHSASDIIHAAKGAISPGSNPEDPKKNERPEAVSRKSYTLFPKLPSPGNDEERQSLLIPQVASDIIHSANDIIHSTGDIISPGNSSTQEDPKKNQKPKSYTSFLPKFPSFNNGDERQPLLVPQVASDIIHSANDIIHSAGDIIDPEDARKRQDALGWKSYTFYGIMCLLGLLALTLLIKGFIDAGDVEFDLKKALMSALGGGLSGAAAMVLQVLTLMPLRTVMNYQYRYGSTMTQAILILYVSGGWKRYYQGISAALIQGPVSRFGDTAANAGILALLQSNTYMNKLPPLVKTIFASLAAAAFRMILTPVDTVKTTMQTQGSSGMAILRARVKRYGIGSLWYGAIATAAATFVGHYPWFGTFNYLEETLPVAHTLVQKLLRSAFIGFVASVISDTVSNSLRVVKTYRQVNETRIGYWAAARAVMAVDGVKGLFGRGLKTRILANGLQGLMFSVLWKFFMDLWNDKRT